jgi:hypothetical protein
VKCVHIPFFLYLCIIFNKCLWYVDCLLLFLEDISFPCLPFISWFDMLSLTGNRNWIIIYVSLTHFVGTETICIHELNNVSEMSVLGWALLFIDEPLDKCSVGRPYHSIVCLSVVFFPQSTHFVCSEDIKPFSGIPRFTSIQKRPARNFIWIFPLQFSAQAFRCEFWNLEVLEVSRLYYRATYVLFLLFGLRINLYFFVVLF